MTDRQARRLFLRYRATGDPEALGRVFDLTASRLLLLALHLVGDGQQAEDLVQTTFLHAIRGAKTYDDSRPLMPWLVGILSHRAKNLERRQSLRRNRLGKGDPLPENTADRHPGPARSAQDNEAIQHIAEALNKVPSRYRQVLVLHLVHGLRPAQIAHALERSPETVRTQLHRGRDMLRKALPRGLSVPLTAITAGLTGAGLQAARAQVIAAAKTAMPVTATTSSATAVIGAVGKSIWLGAASVLFAMVAGLMAWTVFHQEPDASTSQPDKTINLDHSVPDSLALHPTPPAERSELHTAATDPKGSLLVAVVDESGRRLAGATVWRWQKGGLDATSKTTDKSGRVVFVGSETAGAVIARSPGQQVRWQELESLAGEHRIELPPTKRLQGWVQVDGELPVEPIRLQITGLCQPKAWNFLPEHLREEVLGKTSTRTVTTGVGGTFELGGLGDDWRGTIRLPQHIWLRGESLRQSSSQTQYSLPAPITGLKLTLTQLPSVRGQVVWADTGKCVPDARVSVHVHLADGDTSPLTGVRVDAEGRFSFGAWRGNRIKEWANHPERRPAMAKIFVWIAHDDAIQRRITFDAEKLASSGDVGTIRLERAARICCLVVDQAGTPIQGALILGESVSEPTDQAGRTTVLAADRGQRRFLAGAVRYRIDEVQVQAGSGTEQRPFLLRLPPGNVLRIRVRDPKGAVPTGLRVLVSTSTKGPLFTGSKGGRHTRLHFCLGTRYSSAQLGSSKKPRLVYQYYLEPSARGKGEPGEIVLVSLVESPGLVVRVIDRLDQEVAVRHLDSLGISGCKNLAINLERELVAISGRVVDPKGNPLSSRVAFRSSSADTRGRVHCKGRFQLPRVYPTGARYSIVATSPGYVRSTIDVVLQPSIEPLEFRIVPGRDVRVELVDRNRNRVPAACQVDVAGYDRFACVETGVWRFPGLPLGVVTFSTRIGHRRFEMQHDTRTGDARFLLPVPGRCVMEANALLRPKDVDLVTFQVRHTGSGDIAAELQLRGRHARKNLLQTEAFLLLPGRYTAEFGSGRGASFQALTEAKPLTIKAGELSRCRWMDAPRRLPSK